MNTEKEIKTADVSLEVLRPNPWNRKRVLDDAFVTSIQTQGILSPLLVRGIMPGEKGFEIVCGERRFLAAQKLGMDDVPVRIMELDDDAARLICLIENTHRENLTPWQRAEYLRDLSDRPGWDIATAANMLGWSQPVIRKCTQLLQLTKPWQKRAASEKAFARWTTPMWELLAAYPVKIQDAVFEETDDYDGDSMDLDDLRRALGTHTHELRNAPWSVSDVTLDPKAGACAACPKRTGATPDLFEGDMTPERGGRKPSKAGDRCLDVPCWNHKLAASLAIKTATLREKNPDAMLISEHYNPRDAGAGVVGSSKYTDAKKGDSGAVVALIVDGENAGRTTYVIPAANVNRVADVAAGDKGKTMKEKRAALELRRWIYCAAHLQEMLRDNRANDPGKLSLQTIAAIAAVFGVTAPSGYKAEMSPTWESIDRLTKTGESVIEKLWQCVAVTLVRTLGESVREKNPEDDVKHVAALLTVDVVKLKAMADQEIPEPKSWAKEDPLAGEVKKAVKKPGATKPAKAKKKAAKKAAKK